MLDMSYWLIGRFINEIEAEHLDEFDKVQREFMDIFEKQEVAEVSAGKRQHNISITDMTHRMWNSKGVLFWNCISSTDGRLCLLTAHIFALNVTVRTALSCL